MEDIFDKHEGELDKYTMFIDFIGHRHGENGGNGI